MIAETMASKSYQRSSSKVQTSHDGESPLKSSCPKSPHKSNTVRVPELDSVGSMEIEGRIKKLQTMHTEEVHIEDRDDDGRVETCLSFAPFYRSMTGGTNGSDVDIMFGSKLDEVKSALDDDSEALKADRAILKGQVKDLNGKIDGLVAE